ncbi:hypothetical protein ES702_01382 [subsurface metagenome]
MIENKTIRIGSESLILEKISHKVFRKINPRKKGKYLCYFSPGEGYYRIKRENSLPALKKQLNTFLEKRTVYSEDDFIKDISFLPVYIYNNLLFFEDKSIPFELRTWQHFFRSYLESREIPTISFNLILAPIKGWKKSGLTGKGLDFLYYWLLQVVRGKVKVKVCSADDCKRLYIESKGDQKYCSEQCLQRSLKRRKKSEKNKIP